MENGFDTGREHRSASRRIRVERPSDGWLPFLSRYRWGVFATLTFHWRQRDPERPIAMFSTFVRDWHLGFACQVGLASLEVRVGLDGPRDHWSGTYPSALRHGRKRPVWVAAVELHASGTNHIHALISPSPMLPNLSLAMGVALWQRRFGLAKVEAPRSQEDVIRYITKHAPKHGNIWISNSFRN